MKRQNVSILLDPILAHVKTDLWAMVNSARVCYTICKHNISYM